MEPVGPKANIYFAQAIADAAALLARELNDKRTAKQLLARLKTMSTVPMQAISTAASLLVRELMTKSLPDSCLPGSKTWRSITRRSSLIWLGY